MVGTLERLVSSLDRALVMGILNVTPDSFSDGGAYAEEAAAARRADVMLAEGADIIDVGAESTRPGAPSIDAATQRARLGETIAHLAGRGVTCSIDTTSPDVAAHALDQGATIINLVDPMRAREMAALAVRHRADLVIMHARGAMRDMPGFSRWPDDGYQDVVAEVAHELDRAASEAMDAGLARDAIALDPGFGFSKNAAQSLAVAAHVDAIVALGFRVVVGASRKSFLARLTTPSGATPPPPEDRLAAGLVVATTCVGLGASVVRTHDVAPTRQALAMSRALTSARRAPRAPRDGEVARA